MENISKLLKICSLDCFEIIDVFSIGCGATPDLMAFEKNDLFETINYLGMARLNLSASCCIDAPFAYSLNASRTAGAVTGSI